MNFVERLKALAAKQNLSQKLKDNTLTTAEWTAFKAAYKQEHGTDLDADNEAYNETLQNARIGQQISALFEDPEKPESGASANSGASEQPVASSEGGEPNKPEAKPESKDDDKDIVSMVRELISTNKNQEKTIQEMAKQAAPDQSSGQGQMMLLVSGPGTTATHLFGIQHPMYSLDKRWNKVGSNAAFATLNPLKGGDEDSFLADARSFGNSLFARYQQLHNDGRLNLDALKSLTFTTSGLADAGLGDQYMLRRQDALIARILEIPSVASLFPTRYGIQDRELITNAFFSELTQAFQGGRIFKGGMSLEPEYGYVDDVMIKVQFGSMKEIERKYIGYLNTNGSDPIKWNMIEFALLGLYKVAANEYNIRKIMGIGVKPEAGKAGHFKLGSTGVIYTLIRYMHELKLKPHADADYASYSSSTMLSDVLAFISDVRESVTAKGESLDGFAINLNASHKSWWLSNIRTTYGQQTDFSGVDSYANVVPDTDIRIRWIPNMGQLTFMWLEQPGNIQFLENLPGEMLAVQGDMEMEEVLAWSNWKEGTAAAFVGRKFASLAALEANGYEMQKIFCNKPCVDLLADATTLDATKGFWFKSIANNTSAPVITDISNAVKGVAYILECGNATFASKIAKSGKFANLTAAYTPTAVGDYIMVVLNSDGDGFLELERCVGGARTINTATQPNVPGAR